MQAGDRRSIVERLLAEATPTGSGMQISVHVHTVNLHVHQPTTSEMQAMLHQLQGLDREQLRKIAQFAATIRDQK